MALVRRQLLRCIPAAVERCHASFGIDFPITFVIHVGIGCGAGWATRFRGRPAVLFGLENATEVGWRDATTITALVEHEISHLIHDQWRRRGGRGGIERHRGAWWQLYTEGFATACELKLGAIGTHHSTRSGERWLEWCASHRYRLASLFLRSVRHPQRIRRFFGSWYPLQGHIETGYYLGSEVIREWERTAGLREIARWEYPRVRRRARLTLETLASR